MMKLLPTAARIGFTGTPLLSHDNITARTFGGYISVYDFKRAVEDGATVPLYYEMCIRDRAKSALYLPVEAQYDYLLNLPEDIKGAALTSKDGQVMTSLGEVVNNAMALIEDQSAQLTGILPLSLIHI